MDILRWNGYPFEQGIVFFQSQGQNIQSFIDRYFG